MDKTVDDYLKSQENVILILKLFAKLVNLKYDNRAQNLFKQIKIEKDGKKTKIFNEIQYIVPNSVLFDANIGEKICISNS